MTEVKNLPGVYRRDFTLWDETANARVPNKLRFIFFEMPKFKKKVNELKTQLDKWLFAMNNLWLLDEKPAELGDTVFEQFFEEAALAKLPKEDFYAYQSIMKDRLATINGYKLLEAKGEERGRAAEKNAMILSLKAQGVSPDIIAKASGMPLEYVQNLQDSPVKS